MSSNDKKLDDFWDLSNLVPRTKHSFNYSTPSAIEIESEKKSQCEDEKQNDGGSVIKRYIPLHGESEKLSNSNLSEIGSYCPKDSLIHKVTIKKWKTQYNYYGTFLNNALEYLNVSGQQCDYIPFFSYVPQYDQMSYEQMQYYFWFRQNARKGIYIKTDFCYLSLYVYELLNLGDRLDVNETQYILTELWNHYHGEFPSISSKLATWICDYSLLHRLPPPPNANSDILKSVNSLREFYINMPSNNVTACARSLMKYCSSYDFRVSKFVNEDNINLFNTHILGSLIEAVKYYSKDGKILSSISFGDSVIERDVYTGAVCTAEEKYRIAAYYCSFSRSNELRFLVGDVIKYAENKLRTFLGIKSKMTVYSVSVELRKILDHYFEVNLPSRKPTKRTVEKNAYDALYDVPTKKLSLSDAAKIEEDSWHTTKELIFAFEDDADIAVPAPVETHNMQIIDSKIDENKEKDTVFESSSCFIDNFGKYKCILSEIISGNFKAVFAYSQNNNVMCDAIVDGINEIAFDLIGDSLIEDDGNGGHNLIEDYRYLFEQAEK